MSTSSSDFHESASSRLRIAVAGATGRVGSRVADRLRGDDVEVVALTRQRRDPRIPDDVTAVQVDFQAPASLSSALQGTDRLFLSQGSSPDQVANEIALIEAAGHAGVGHIVKLSSFGPPTRLHPLDWHMRIEAYLAQQSVGYTVLRPSAFFDIVMLSARAIASGAWYGAAGDGRINFIDVRDVADVARIALLDPHVAPGTQRAYHLTGSAVWTMPGVASELARLLGHPVVYHHTTPEEREASLRSAGAGDFTVDLLMGLDRMFRESVMSETTLTVQQLTGKPPRSLTGWLSDNLAAFRA